MAVNLLYDLKNSLAAEWNGMNLTLWGGLNSKNKQEILQVQELFLLYIGSSSLKGASLPDQIKFLKEKSGFMYVFTTKSYVAATKLQLRLIVPQQSAIQFLPSVWEDRMKGSGQLRGYAIDIISEICAYQQAKELDHNSAECMFLEELKHWATYELALYALNKDNLKAINNRVRYMEQVLAQKNLFYSSRWESRTVQQIILETCLQLKYSVIPEIKNDLAIQSARERLSYFRSELKLALQHAVYFLYHVFRDSGKQSPESITITKILRQAGPEFTTSSGELLFHIMSSGAFTEAFPDSTAQLRTRLIEQKTDDEEVAPPNFMDTATLFTRDGSVCLPADLWTTMTGKPAPLGSEDSVLMTKERLIEVFSRENPNTGLEEGFLSHPYIAEQFIKAHGTIQELAKFVQIIIKAEKCAAAGGDLLIYGFANKQLNALLDLYRGLVKKVRSQFEILLRIAELRFQQLVNQNRAQTTRNTWIAHYRNIHTKMYKLDHQLSRTEECSEEILSHANSLTLYERFQRLQIDTEDFITTSDMYASHLNAVLKVPYNEAISQKILITGPQMPFPDLLLQEKGKEKTKGSAKNAEEDWPSAMRELEEKSATMVSLQTCPKRLRRGYQPQQERSKNTLVSSLLVNHPGLSGSGEEGINIPGLVPIIDIDKEEEVDTKVLDFAKQHITDEDFIQSRVQLKLQTGFSQLAPGRMLPDIQSNLTVPEMADLLFQMNEMNSVAVSALINFLSSDKIIEKVRYLNLSGNKLDEEAANSLESFLSLPKCNIQHLDISDCNFDDACMEHIFQSLRFNSNMRILLAQDNKLTDRSVQVLCVGLLANPDSKLTQISLDETRTDDIPFTEEGITLLNSLLSKRPKLTVQLHNDAVPLSEPAFADAAAFNKFGIERRKRVQQQRQRARELQDLEKQMEDTLNFFRDLIHVCQVHQRCSGVDAVSLTAVITAFQYGAYGVKLPDGFTVINKYFRAAENLGVVKIEKKRSGEQQFILHPIAKKWTVPVPEAISEIMKDVDLVVPWQQTMPAMVTTLQTPKPRPNLLRQLSTSGPLQEYADEVIDALLELCIFRGIVFIQDEDEEMCTFNTITDEIPIDFTSFPGYHVAVFAPSKNKIKPASNSSSKPSKDKKDKEKEKDKERGRERGRDRDPSTSSSGKKKKSRSRSRSLTRWFGSDKDKDKDDEDEEEVSESKADRRKSRKVKDKQEEEVEEEIEVERKPRRRASSISLLKKMVGK